MKTIFGQQTTKVKQLADLISQDISMGRYKTDTALPSINQLSHDYKVSRDTVFKAFIDLKERGIIDSTPGKGYYVVNRQKNILLLLDEYSPFKDTLYNSIIHRTSVTVLQVAGDQLGYCFSQIHCFFFKAFTYATLATVDSGTNPDFRILFHAIIYLVNKTSSMLNCAEISL
jgi:DNA-binding transcriptional regulator YhcF (GntR family)